MIAFSCWRCDNFSPLIFLFSLYSRVGTKYWPLFSPLLWGRSRHFSQPLAIVLTSFVREVAPFLITMFKFVLYGVIGEILQAADVHYLGVSRFLSRSNHGQVGHLAEVFKESVINILHGVCLSFDTCWFKFSPIVWRNKNVCSWNCLLDGRVNGVTFHVCVSLQEFLLNNLLVVNGEFLQCLRQDCIPILVCATVVIEDVLVVLQSDDQVVMYAGGKFICGESPVSFMPKVALDIVGGQFINCKIVAAQLFLLIQCCCLWTWGQQHCLKVHCCH